MSGSGSWLARVARQISEIIGGMEKTEAGQNADWHPDTIARVPDRSTSMSDDDGHPGIRPDRNGRYVTGGYSFSTLEQAAEHQRRTERRAAPATVANPLKPALIKPVTQRPTADPAPPMEKGPVAGHPGLELDANGRYVARGFSFSTLQQAADYERRMSQPPPPPPPEPRMVQHAATSSPVPDTARERPRWIVERSRLEAGGTTFEADMVYYGTPVDADRRYNHSRIDPKLRVDPRGDQLGTTLDYWPSYAKLDPRARHTYLNWLQAGRNDAAIPIGYVFVFFYGLEQRLLLDDARDEAPAILAEVRRLLALHGENYSFQSYATKLLALSCLTDETEPPPSAQRAQTFDLEIPLDVRVRLGRRLRDGRPFDADDTLHWILGLPDVYLRTPGQRCFDELRELWSRRFAIRHPQGLTVRRPQRTIKHQYRAASGGFTADVDVHELPDISGTTAPLAQLRGMFDGCMEDLSVYSRLLGREPEARGHLRADLLLPSDLRADRPSLAECQRSLAELGGTGAARTTTAAALALALDIDLAESLDKLPSVASRQIGIALDALDLGFEPDRRYGPGAPLRPDTPVSIFSAPSGGAVDPDRAAYAAARGMIEVAMLAAAADGEVVAAELEVGDRRLGSLPDLAEHEVARLKACGRALTADPPKMRAALKRLAAIPAQHRAALAASAVEAVLADGRVQPEEVKFLEALHVALGLPAAALYSSLHRGTAEVDPVPVLVSIGREQPATKLPEERLSGVSLSIDMARLERIRGETTKVSALLATIFVEEEQPEPVAQTRLPNTDSSFQGLDARHSELLSRLLAGPLPRADFDAAAATLRLMPDGAIEAINEWAFDQFGEAAVEDDDGVRIAPDMMKQVQPMGVAA
jgi:tellurite resistance protein